ncbi:MAG: leucine--tRNA ligase [Patescibacteria group bacterium]
MDKRIKYEPAKIEPKWQKKWERAKIFKATDFAKKKKYYALVEFPYPSGEGLHLGHAFTCTILDIFARKKRMSGENVLYPMGWDAFGLPTENYAIRTGIHPAVATKKNTDQFRAQMKRLAFAYNWEREINTTDPNYYKWTQWIFIQMFKHGLAYKAETPVGWCPSCKIILANEEIVGGKCERCGAVAEYRRQKQWLLQITAYADRLIDELDLVDYPDYVKTAQINWIGKTSGVVIEYPVVGSNLTISCYSTRPDTNFGATFVAIAPEHPILRQLKISAFGGKNEKLKIDLEKYIEMAKKKSELERTELAKEKTGVFTGNYALNQLSGKKMPIYVSDFVVLTAGTGIVVGVPAHDQRDFEFAKKYNLEIIPVVKPKKGEWDFAKGPFLDIDEATVFNSDFLNGLPALEAKEKIIDYLMKKGWGKKATNYHLRDWIFSRQHYWGEPIPMIYCPTCARKGIKPEVSIGVHLRGGLDRTPREMAGWFPVPEEDLPVKLPKVERYKPSESGESPLAKIKEWVEVACPKCGKAARRETDTMPNWAGSSWYFLRYCDPKNQKCLADPKKLRYWMPVDIYLGGAEHTTLHLLYSRFWHKFLNDIGVAPGKEPYAARRQHGVILGEDGFRMSKSRGNVINPDEVISQFGVDTLRVYLMFMGPYESTMPWSSEGVEGCFRFLKRVWQLVQEKVRSFKTPKHLEVSLHQTIKKVSENIEDLKFNTALARMMEFVNQWSKPGMFLNKKEAKVFLQLLAPFAPYLSEELWSRLGGKFSIHTSAWPKYDKKLIEEEIVTVIVQINGKLRDKIEMGSEKCGVRSEIERLARESEKIKKYLAGKKIKKVIFVPGKLINFVL